MSILRLPVEIQLNILRWLPLDDVISCQLVNRQFCNHIDLNRKYMQRPIVDRLLIDNTAPAESELCIFIDSGPLYMQLSNITIKSTSIQYQYVTPFPDSVVKTLHRFVNSKEPDYTRRSPFAQEFEQFTVAFKTVDWAKDLKRLLSFLIQSFDVKLVELSGRPFDCPVLSDCICDSFREYGRSKKKRGIPLLFSFPPNNPFYVNLYRALGSSNVVSETGLTTNNGSLVNFDTDYQIHFPYLRFDNTLLIEDLLKEWTMGLRNIRKLTLVNNVNFVRWSVCKNDMKIFLNEFSNANILSETFHSIQCQMRRDWDQKIIRIDYFTGEAQKAEQTLLISDRDY